MEDGSKAPHSMASGGQQRNQHHPRPFFYVQPPSQPYYAPYQQWQMNNPYGHYGMYGGFNMGRPCLNPYQYMQFPGFVFPQAPLYPMDFRRMFEPRFPSPHWDASFNRHQPPPPHPPEHRETASSGAQTDPSDAITKLIERLDQMKAGDAARGKNEGTDRELDSGVGSQTSAMFSPSEKKKPEQLQVHQTPPRGQRCLATPASTFSTTAVYDGDSSQRSLEEILSPGERHTAKLWAGDAEDEVLPLDSSSVQEDHAEEQVVPLETSQNEDDVQADVTAMDQSVPLCDERRDERPSNTSGPEEEGHSKKAFEDLRDDTSFQILKLPLELSSEAKGLSPLTRSPFYYNYMAPQSTHERLSVLSPSLDELSSRDEMFSTDLEEVELFPRRHVYAGGRRVASEDMEEIWTMGSRRPVCACCGKSLPRGATTRSRVHCSKVYLDGDTDEEGRFGRGAEQPIRVVVRKHSGARKTQPLPQRITKSWTRRGPNRDETRDHTDPIDQDPERREGPEEEEESHRSAQERLCGEEPLSEQSRWTEGAVRKRTTAPQQRQELSQRKVMYHRPRDEEDEPPQPSHWDRGAVTRDPPR